MINLLDNFVGPNGQPLAAHAPTIGGPWTDPTPNWQINGNMLHQVGDNPQSLAPLLGRVFTLDAVVNLNGCDPANLIDFAIFDVAGAVGPELTILGNGTVRLFQQELAGSVTQGQAGPAPPVISLAGDHAVRLTIGPSRVVLSIDGQRLIDTARFIPTNQVFTQLQLTGGALNALPSPLLKSINVGY